MSEEFHSFRALKAVSVAWHDRSCCLLRRNTRIGRLLKRADHARHRLKRHNKLFVCRSFSADESYLERQVHIGKSKIINDQRQDLEYGDACEKKRKKEVWRKKKEKREKTNRNGSFSRQTGLKVAENDTSYFPTLLPERNIRGSKEFAQW